MLRMIRCHLFRLLVTLAFVTPALAATQMPSRELPWRDTAAVTFRAPDMASRQSVTLDAPQEKSAAGVEEQPGGRMRVAAVRALPKSASVEGWTAIAGGYVTRLTASSAAAEGLRVRLDSSELTDSIQVRVQGSDGRIEALSVEPVTREAWTPWTEGEAQVIELYSRTPQAVNVGAMLHFLASPVAKAAASCTVPTPCSTNDTALDLAIAQRKKSVMRINFIEGASGFVCTATLINTERFPAAYVLTANHCVNTPSVAATVSSLWFYETSLCTGTAVAPGQAQVAGGMQLVHTNNSVDSTLLLMPQIPPVGALYSAWNTTRLAKGAAVTSISHPSGDTTRLAVGTMADELRIVGHPQDMYGVRFTRGIIEGGSSGSGLFQMVGASLQLVGVLSGSTIRSGGSMSCTNLDEDALYGRFEVFERQIDQFIRTATQAADDAPNRVQDVTTTTAESLDLRGSTLNIANRRIDYAGDLDLYRFTLSQQSSVHVWSVSSLDTIGSILDSNGKTLESNDDEAEGDVDFGITRTLPAGTYYVLVGHWDSDGTGAYALNMSATPTALLPPTINYTDLWWNAAEPGWGVNINHQGNTLFATLFTYRANGSPMWLVMSGGARQEDGSYSGLLYRTAGPPFNASPWVAATATSIGTMRFVFSGAGGATINYSVDGVNVTKTITRQVFGTPPTCTFTESRGAATNWQDLWWNSSESGWGLNLTQQGSTMFATLFTYDASGQPVWYVMSGGTRSGTAAIFTGGLYKTAGPVFNASPWTPASAAQVGTMTLNFSAGTLGTLTYSIDGVQVTKNISRQVFANPPTLCQ